MSKNSIEKKTTASNIGGLVSFLTVARASANRMLDAPLGMVSTWVDGQPLYSTSFGGSDWHWQADFPAATVTDNETTCRPTSWVAGGLNGAAVRSEEGNRNNLSQTAWQVNSTAADNEGAGTVLDPLKLDVEIQRRWGQGKRAQLSAPVTVTYAQAPTTHTNFYVELLVGGQLHLTGTPTITKPGTVLTAVQVQVRTPGAELGWAITAVGLGATDVGKLAVITAGTAANIGAYAAVLKDETGGKVRVSPFGKFSATTTLFTQVTPVIGDTIEIREPMVILVGEIESHLDSNTTLSGANATTYLAFHQIRLSSTEFAGTIRPYGTGALYDMCSFVGIGFGGQTSGQAPNSHRVCGGVVTGSVTPTVRTGAGVTFSQTGLLVGISVNPGSVADFGADCYFQNCNGPTGLRGTAIRTNGIAFFDRTAANFNLNVGVGACIAQLGAVPDWGTNNAGYALIVASSGVYNYVTKPTINSGLGVGREARIGGTDKLYSAVPYIEGANGASLVLSA